MKKSTKQLVAIFLFLVLFLALVSNCNIIEGATGGAHTHKKEPDANNSDTYTECTQAPDNCDDCVNAYIQNAGYVCKWNKKDGCNSFSGRSKCPGNTNKDVNKKR